MNYDKLKSGMEAAGFYPAESFSGKSLPSILTNIFTVAKLNIVSYLCNNGIN
jgi:hypothetical protein